MVEHQYLLEIFLKIFVLKYIYGYLDPQKLIKLKINHMNIFSHENFPNYGMYVCVYVLYVVCMYVRTYVRLYVYVCMHVSVSAPDKDCIVF